MPIDKTKQKRFEDAVRQYIDVALPEGSAGRLLSTEVAVLFDHHNKDHRLADPAIHQDFAEVLKSLLSREKQKFDIPDLFQKNATHIQEIRVLIEAVKEFCQPEQPAYKAAEQIEIALNNMAENVYRPRSVARQKTEKSPKAVRLINYGSSNSKISATGGLIVKEYGDWKIHPEYKMSYYDGDAIVQIPSEWLVRNLTEGNAYMGTYVGGHVSTNKHPVDFEVIMQDGTAHRFNFYNQGADGKYAPMGCQDYIRTLPGGEEFLKMGAVRRHNERLGISFSAPLHGALSEDNKQRSEELLKAILPALEKRFPPAIDLQKKRGGVGE